MRNFQIGIPEPKTTDPCVPCDVHFALTTMTASAILESLRMVERFAEGVFAITASGDLRPMNVSKDSCRFENATGPAKISAGQKSSVASRPLAGSGRSSRRRSNAWPSRSSLTFWTITNARSVQRTSETSACNTCEISMKSRSSVLRASIEVSEMPKTSSKSSRRSSPQTIPAALVEACVTKSDVPSDRDRTGV